MQISVITATYNAGKHLPFLIKSLQAQTNSNFEWVIADGGSTDNTLEILNNVEGLNIKINSQADFGIYDGLNRAIKLSKGEYYVVIGSDDLFEPTAIETFSKAIDGVSTVITCPILIGDKEYKRSSLPSFIAGARSKICGHSIATLFKRNLHEKYGYYSKKYPIAADYDFTMKLVVNDENIKFCDSPVGRFGTDGVSAVDHIGSASEVMRVMIANGYFAPIQVAIFILRLLYSALKAKK